MAFNTMKPGAEEDLLRRLKSGDSNAWTQYTRDYGARVYSYLQRSLPNAEDVEDVLSETMLAAVKAVRTFDGQASLLTFTISIAHRKLADFWRKRPQTTELDESVHIDAINPDSLVFQEAFNKLSPPAKEVLLLRYQMGLGVPEIATSMNRSYKAVESLLSRSREQLRKALNGEDPTGD